MCIRDRSKVLVRYQPLFQAITKLLPVIVIIFGGHRVIEGKITLGTLGAFVEYSMNIVWPMEMLGWLFNDFAAAVASNEKLKKIYRQYPEDVYKRQEKKRMNPLTFSYLQN